MKERPILFSGPMVRAILDGRKTVTRRVVKPAPYGDLKWNQQILGKHVINWTDDLRLYDCPYGLPGDRLWVRESWRVGKPHDKTKPVDILPSVVARGQGVTVLYDAGGWKSVGPAGREEPIYPDDAAMPDWAGKGRPSIHMPRDFCRILLEITDVRVERLQDISEEQALAEGVPVSVICPGCDGDDEGCCVCDHTGRVKVGGGSVITAKAEFESLWESINGTESWAANPWVWVVEFKRVEVANAEQVAS